jgi:16S rRNA (cytidine1402-2'-O)-methyltransferase
MDTLTDMRSILGDRRTALARELTKLHEETLRGSLNELLAEFRGRRPRGEFTIVCEGYKEVPRTASGVPRERLERELRYLTEVEGLTRRDAVKELAVRHRLPRQAVYRLLSG